MPGRTSGVPRGSGAWRVWGWAWVPFRVAHLPHCLRQPQQKEEGHKAARGGPPQRLGHRGAGAGKSAAPSLQSRDPPERSTQQGLGAGSEPCTPPRKRTAPQHVQTASTGTQELPIPTTPPRISTVGLGGPHVGDTLPQLSVLADSVCVTSSDRASLPGEATSNSRPAKESRLQFRVPRGGGGGHPGTVRGWG